MPPASSPRFTIVIPAYNEEGAIAETIEEVSRYVPDDQDYVLLVVDDGSTDATYETLQGLAERFPRLRVIKHDRNRGYGAALKTGIAQATSEFIVITDADGTYPNERIVELVELCHDQDMVVGARTGPNVTYSKVRAFPKFFLKQWVSWLAGREIPDINSGLRVFRRDVAERFFGILSDKFSFTITITLAMLTTWRPVLFVPIDYKPRIGKSKIKPVQDTLRFVSLILRTGTYFAPLRAFAPIFGILIAAGSASFAYDVFVLDDLTDKTILFFLFALNVGMFALLADMFDKRMR